MPRKIEASTTLIRMRPEIFAKSQFYLHIISFSFHR